MDIKELLNKEIEAANQANERKKENDYELEKKALELFSPIAAAAVELQEQLSKFPEIVFNISENFISIRLGKDSKLESHLYGWSRCFKVEETNIYRYPEYEEFESNLDFTDSSAVIEYLIKKCADYVSKRQTTTETG